MNATEQLLPRTKNFAVRVMRLVDTLPNRRAANVVGNQILRSATSVGANYRTITGRGPCRASSAKFSWLSSRETIIAARSQKPQATAKQSD